MSSKLDGMPVTKRVLEVLAQRTKTAGYPPSLRELTDAMGMSSTNSVRRHLDILESAGLVHRDRRVSRGVVVTNDGEAALAEAS